MGGEPNRLVREIGAEVGEGVDVCVTEFTATGRPPIVQKLVTLFDVRGELITAMSVEQARDMVQALEQSASAVARSRLSVVDGGARTPART